MAAPRRVIVYGGKGALGSTIVNLFRSKNWWVGSIDLAANDEASANIVVSPADTWVDQSEVVAAKVAEVLEGNKLDAVLCVAGGWAGGNAASKDLVKNADLMWKQSVWTSVIASSVSAHHLKEGGMLVLTGAQSALKATPGTISYGMAKAAVHQLVASLSNGKSGLPANSCVAAILPITLDTPMNRKFMSQADFSCWTPLETVAELLYKWSDTTDRPENGSLVQMITKGGATEYVVIPSSA